MASACTAWPRAQRQGATGEEAGPTIGVIIFGSKSRFWSDSLQKGQGRGGLGGAAPQEHLGVRGRRPRNFCSDVGPPPSSFPLPPSLFSFFFSLLFSSFLLLFVPESCCNSKAISPMVKLAVCSTEGKSGESSPPFSLFSPPFFPFPFSSLPFSSLSRPQERSGTWIFKNHSKPTPQKPRFGVTF